MECDKTTRTHQLLDFPELVDGLGDKFLNSYVPLTDRYQDLRLPKFDVDSHTRRHG